MATINPKGLTGVKGKLKSSSETALWSHSDADEVFTITETPRALDFIDGNGPINFDRDAKKYFDHSTGVFSGVTDGDRYSLRFNATIVPAETKAQKVDRTIGLSLIGVISSLLTGNKIRDEMRSSHKATEDDLGALELSFDVSASKDESTVFTPSSELINKLWAYELTMYARFVTFSNFATNNGLLRISSTKGDIQIKNPQLLLTEG